MGIDYAYEIIADRTAGEKLVRAVAKRCTPERAARLCAAIANGAERVMFEFERDGIEGGNSKPRDVCLSFCFPLDAKLIEDGAFVVDEPFPHAQVGCIWSEFLFGEKFVYLQAVAATTGMSLLFERSPSIRRTFVEIAEEAGARLAMFDDEQGINLAVWPVERRIAARPRPEGSESSEPAKQLQPVYGTPEWVDAWCADQLERAGLVP